MGNRAMIKLIDAHSPEGVVVYLHSHADYVKGWLKDAAPRMRLGDASYAAARFIGFCHDQIDGGFSLGVMPGSEAADPENGLYVVDCSTGKVTLFREGRDGELARSGRPFSIPMGRF